MKPYGIKRARETGCLCGLCRSRGYRKGRAYGELTITSKSRARREWKREAALAA